MRTVLLGPLREGHHLAAEVERAAGGRAAPIAVITAGRREWEGHGRGPADAAARPLVDLALFRRGERVRAADPEFAAAHREHQGRVRLLRRSYNLRLAQAAAAWLGLEQLEGHESVLGPERESACEAVRDLDAHHLARLAALRAEFVERWRPGERAAVQRERAELGRLLGGVELVLIAGGHVPVLLDRIRLFGLEEWLAERSVIAWAGGAMALTERVVFFHDSPPWGPGHSEAGAVGLGRVAGLVVLPDAGRRLRLDDPARVGRLARRLAPFPALVLDRGDRVEWQGDQLVEKRGRLLSARAGAVIGVGAQ